MPHSKKNKKMRKLARVKRPSSKDENHLSSISAGVNGPDDSEIAIPINESNETKENISEEHGEINCLALIKRMIDTLQVANNTFPNIMKNILDITDTDDVASRTIKYDLINTMLEMLSESDMKELSIIRHKVTEIINSKHMLKLYVNDDAIKLLEVIGRGSFGVVFRGTLDTSGVCRTVAIKCCKETSTDKLFEREAWTMSQFTHENILKIIAISENKLEIVMELMELGSIDDALSSQRAHFTLQNIWHILNDVVSGMEYIHGKSFLHRDLASRNIFIDGKKRCKIGDFGSCVYVGDSNMIFEDKKYEHVGINISPETMESQIFTVQSDVWSMGILIWHVFHLISSSTSDEDLFMLVIHLRSLQAGRVRLERPLLCPESLYRYTRDFLLSRRVKERPSFTAIKKKMEEISNKK